MPEPKIFVGMILGGEPGIYLPYSMGAVYDIVDYFIVVDTGVTDGSLEKFMKEQDPKGKVIMIKSSWMNDYSAARNVYLKFFRDRIWTPSDQDTNYYYWRIDFDEQYEGNLPYLKEYLKKFSHQMGFRFHFSTFDSSHFTLNEVQPQESRVNLFRYNPSIKYKNSIHEIPVYSGGGFEQILYGDEVHDIDLGIQFVPVDVASYLHFSYCDEKTCAKKIMNYTEQYVRTGIVTPEKLEALKKGDNWAWTDHKSSLKFTGVYPTILKTAPFLQNPPWKILFEDGSCLEPKKIEEPSNV